MSKKTFIYEFESEGPRGITLEHSLTEEEQLDVTVLDGAAHLRLNRTGMLTLAKWMIKMAEGDYAHRGYHLHINQDFDRDTPERLVLYRTPDTNVGQRPAPSEQQ